MYMLQHPVFYVGLGLTLLSISAALLGGLMLLRREALLAEVMAHTLLPGIGLGFLLYGRKHYGILLASGALSACLALWLIEQIPLYSKLKMDTSMAVVMASFFGVGIALLGKVQQMPGSDPSGLQDYLFGKAAAIVPGDLWALGALALVTLCLFYAKFPMLRMMTFDMSFAQTIGIATQRWQGLVRLLTIFVIMAGVQVIGTVLMVAVFIVPSLSASYWSNRLVGVLVGAVWLAIVASWIGIGVSYSFPGAPTGPCVVIILALLACLSFVCGAYKGLGVRYMAKKQYQRLVQTENVLKWLYVYDTQEGSTGKGVCLMKLVKKLGFAKSHVSRALYFLSKKKKFVTKSTAGKWMLTPAGRMRGKQLLYVHELWEKYLTVCLQVDPVYVHEEAELVEHLLTPELIQQLEHRLQHVAK